MNTPKWIDRLMKKRWALIAALAGGLVVLVVVLVLLSSGSEEPAAIAPSSTQSTPQQPRGDAESDPILSRIFGSSTAQAAEAENWPARLARVALRLAVAALLAAVLAFRPRPDMPIVQRDPYVMQSQILLAVVASALMMVVGDNAARAFGIFAAASLVRFRTTVRDPKEITVLLASLGVGISCGVGRLEVAIILALFLFVMLLVLEYYEPAEVMRTMELTIEATDMGMADDILKDVFEKYGAQAEIRKVDREIDEDKTTGEISYSVHLKTTTNLDRVSEEILSSKDGVVVAVKWDQKKSSTYTYR